MSEPGGPPDRPVHAVPGTPAGPGRPLRVVIAGGGTGGHLYPGLAVARELLARDPATVVTFVGTAHGIEARVLPREGFVLDPIRSAGLKGKSALARLRGAALLPLGGIDAWRVVSRRRPHVVIGVGGYSSGPVVLAAALRRVPTIVLEQNAVPGLTNRLLARVVDAAALTYAEAEPWFRGKGFVSGNPVRPGFAGVAPALSAHPQNGRRRLLVFGGSQGAHAINLAMIDAAPMLRDRQPVLDVVHQTGERDLPVVREVYERVGLEARVEAFLHDMDREMGAADLIVCRAGATTLAELTAAGRPALLVPLPTATDDHQRKNAAALARAGAAEVLDQGELSGVTLAQRVAALLDDDDRRRAMAAAARRAARPEAARVIADRVLALAGTAAGR
jgi:UDP-N-acetylglucosamine--N-acetylmuramyl-(pentapeptide) pyrophosphoryl-undecaprenol N-acetylglucosamine transferase